MNIKKMRIISIVWGSILVLIVIGLTIIGLTYKKNSLKYKELEEKLEKVTKQYVDQKFLYPEENNELKITVQELQENDAIEPLKIEEEECSGYTIIAKKDSVYSYKAYIKCPKYQTKNYEKYVKKQ